MPEVIEPPSGKRIAIITAHPDDMEHWCAGAVMQAVERGCEACLLLVTSGDKGSGDPDTDPRDLAMRREAEARAAGEVLGLAEVAFLRYLDGEVENTLQLRRELTAVIRRWQPEVVFTHDPDHPLPPYLSHRDHRTVGRATLDCIFPIARDPLNFPEQYAAGLLPCKVGELWLFASAVADSYVDVGSVLERKIAARLEHHSQTSDPTALPDNWRRGAAERGAPVGLEAAEAFTVIMRG